MARGPHPSAVALCLGLALAGGLFLLGHQRVAEEEGRTEEEGRAALSELGRDLETALRAARGRAQSLSASQTLRSAVATDQRTVADMVARDFTLAPRPDETMEIFQVPRSATPGTPATPGAPLSLLRQPADGPPAPTGGAPGTVLSPSGDGILVTAAVRLDPLYRTEELGGLLAVTLRVDAHRVAERLSAAGAAARIEGLSAPLQLGRPGRRVRTVPVAVFVPATGGVVTAQLAVTRGQDGGLRLGALGAGVLGLLLAGLLLGRRSAPRVTEALAGAGGPPPPGGPAPASGGSLPQRPGTDSTVAGAALPTGLAGLIAGKYRIGRPLGQGGMSEVFLGQSVGEADFERSVAIKFLLPAFLNTTVLDYFLDEARLQAKISHPNVVQIYDLGREGKSYFIAMEYVEGMDASALLVQLEARGEQVPLRQALTIGVFACEGLHAAHTATDSDGRPLGLIHRDVKPSNILLGYNGAVKVADFGIAKAEQQSHLTVPGQVKGTLAYMAPEQRAGGAIDRRVDVFGMGAVVYELVTGQRIDLDLAKLLARGLQGWPHLPRPSEVRPALPVALDEILWRALAYDAQARYPDCRALGAALEEVLVRAGLSPSASALGEWLQGRRTA